MRAVIQRVSSASVNVGGEETSSIGPGLLVFLGVEKGDGERDAAYLAGKIARLRVFGDQGGKMNLSVADTGGGVLAVSQFTLAAALKKGNRPSFGRAESPERAEALYIFFMERLKAQGVKVKAGVFGAAMEVALINNGPVTIVMDSRERP